MTEQIISLYNGKVQIRFTPDNHAYWLLGGKKMERLTGVTSFTGKIFDKSDSLIPWALDITGDYLMEHQDELKKKNGDLGAILEEAKLASNEQKERASQIGQAIHTWIESHIQGGSPEMPDDPKVLQGVNSFVEWMEENGAKFLWSERIVYSKKYNFVGTADVGLKLTKGSLKGQTVLGDWKASNGLYSSVRLQTASYQGAIIEESPKEKFSGRLAVRISTELEDEYMERMEKKWARRNYKSPIPEYQRFETRYFPEALFIEDFKHAMAAWGLIQWNRVAEKEIRVKQ